MKSLKDTDIKTLIEGIVNRNFRQIARAISLIENEHPVAEEILQNIFKKTGNSYRIGITGPPGAGKSTLISKLTKIFTEEEMSVGILTVDPTSPFTGGAILGDRIRMTDILDNASVYIRSMATRGSLGGLAQATYDAADILSSAGFDIIIFETVGVGQIEIDVVKVADSTIVVLVPESGDGIQAMKAGLMEISDIFVINKADREGSNRLAMEIESILQMKSAKRFWEPPVIKTIAKNNSGIRALRDSIEMHKNHLQENNKIIEKEEERIEDKINLILQKKLVNQFWDERRKALFKEKLNLVVERKLSPNELVSILFN